MNTVWKFLTSLRLTAVLLALGIVLVFVGTIAQADEGLYQAQARYFKHWFVSGFSFFGHHVPMPLPGGYLLGTALLLNLLAAHIQRFQWGFKKIGIHLTHAGIMVLLVGQLTTDLFSRETQLHFFEGETKNYSESDRSYELVVASDAGDGTQEVVAIPAHLLAKGGEIKPGQLPFAVRVKRFWHNSNLSYRAPMQQNDAPLADNGIARDFDFHLVADAKSMDEKNIPTAVVELAGPNGSLGQWVVSAWAGEEGLVDAVRDSYARRMSPQTANTIVRKLVVPQTVEVAGKTYTFVLRPVRLYVPFSLTLLKATHSVYPGTEIPKDFRSRVQLVNPSKNENREVEIYMNTPLRYAGLTYYQYQMSPADVSRNAGQRPFSVLQVVRNPGWLTPYAGCIIVAVGLVTQFMIHLVGFVKKRRTA